MKVMLDTIEGSVLLNEDFELLGVVTGSVTVARGAHLKMDGLIMCDLVVLEGGSADITGTVMGYVINDGGRVKMRGLDGVLGMAGVLPPQRHRAPRLRQSFWGALRG